MRIQRWLLLAAGAGLVALGLPCGSAEAGSRVVVGVGYGGPRPVYYGRPYYRPYYYAPPPPVVYVAPRPVYVYPPPPVVYVAPPPTGVYQAPAPSAPATAAYVPPPPPVAFTPPPPGGVYQLPPR